MAELSPRVEGDRVVIEMDPGEPVELGDLSESLAALARLYERHYRTSGDEAPKLYITKLETGSVFMEIAPFAPILGVLSLMDNGIIAADFVNRLWRGIRAFSSPASEAPRVEPPSLEDAQDIKEFAKPLLGKSGASLGIKHARYEKTDGEKRVMAEYVFDEASLNRAAINIDRALESTPSILEEPETPSQKFRAEVMLFFEQASRKPGKERGRTGDKGIVPDVSDKPLPVYFRKSARDLKAQMISDANPLANNAYVVDVWVQLIAGEPQGYIISDVHQIVPLDE